MRAAPFGCGATTAATSCRCAPGNQTLFRAKALFSSRVTNADDAFFLLYMEQTLGRAA
jgi:hypothetical protein